MSLPIDKFNRRNRSSRNWRTISKKYRLKLFKFNRASRFSVFIRAALPITNNLTVQLRKTFKLVLKVFRRDKAYKNALS